MPGAKHAFPNFVNNLSLRYVLFLHRLRKKSRYFIVNLRKMQGIPIFSYGFQGYKNKLPVWNTRTETVHANNSWKAIIPNVNFHDPHSFFIVATVAMQGT